MKINDTAAVTNDANSAFSIAATGKAFKILSDGLYSDKIAAVIRELSCNAYDSHVAAGKADVPFEIRLPTYNDLRFSVTDFGTGISDEDIYKIYTRYFASTKTDSNEFVGQLGLGSKSPFSLVREFTVYSRVNGVQRRYRMYFDASDTPRVEFLDETVCDDANGLPKSGVCVEFDVKNSDLVDRFRDRALTILRWFKTTPRIVGNHALISNLMKGHENAEWFDHGIRNSYRHNSLIAIMGNVAYPISINSLENAKVEFYSLASLPIALNFNIGDLEVSASRESIAYDERTIKNITNKLDLVLADIRKTVVDRMATFTKEWDARQYYSSLFGIGARDRHEYVELFKGIKLLDANGVEIDSSSITLDLKTVYNGSGSVWTGSTEKVTMSRVPFEKFKGFKQQCDKRQVVVFNDVERGGNARVRLWIESIIEGKKASKVSDFEYTVYHKPDVGTFDQLRALLGNVDVTLVSTMPEKPRKKKEEKDNRPKMLRFKERKNGRNVWEEVDMDLSKGGFYVELAGKNVAAPFLVDVDIKEVMRWGVMLGLVDTQTVYAGRTPTMKRKLRNADNWHDLMDFMTDKVNRFLIPAKFDKLATLRKWSDVKLKLPFEMYNAVHWKLRDNDGVMGRLIELAKEMSALTNSGDMDKINHYINLARSIGASVNNDGVADARIDQLYKEYLARYPMLTIAQPSYVKSRDKDVLDYVNMVDATHVWFAITDPALDNPEEA